MPDQAEPPLLKVILGEPAESFQARTAPELKPLVSEFGQIVNALHRLQMVVGAFAPAPFETRFSDVDFTAGKVAGVDTNPQEGYLGLTKAAETVASWAQKFTEAGFQNDAAKKLSKAYGDKEVVYRGTKDNFSCVIVLDKAVPKDSDTGRLAKVTEDQYLIHLTVTTATF